MEYKIAVLPGDGIGPEVTKQACDVLSAIGEKFAHTFKFGMADIGGIAYDKTGHPLPKETIDISKASDAILLGAVGGEKWDGLAGNIRPEAALLGIRSELELFANLRPALLYKELASACPLRPEITNGDLDIMIVRELTGGLYFGKRGRTGKGENETAFDTLTYSKKEIRRIGKIAFELAQGRDKKLTSVDKANILESSRLWRTTMEELSANYPDVKLNHLYVDNAAMQLVRNPKQFDVLVTGNLFGDILSDEAAMITGSIGMLPSASLSANGPGLYEPVHGSAPDIAGQGKANPLAAILSVAMLLKWSLHLDKEAETVEKAVKAALATGKRTGDLLEGSGKALSTDEMGKLVLDFIRNS